MTDRGYTVVEPKILGDWLGTMKNREILVAMLSWLVMQVQDTLIKKFPGLHLEVLSIEYMGAYPAIGLQADDSIPDDIEDKIDSLIKELLSSTPLFKFAEFVFDNNVDWREEAEKLLNSGRSTV